MSARFPVRPLADRVIVKPDDLEEKTPGGIVIPDQAKERPARGLVVAVGPGRILESGRKSPMKVASGVSVLFVQHAGVEIKINGQVHLVLREHDILGICE